jgi:hypothetical protein
MEPAEGVSGDKTQLPPTNLGLISTPKNPIGLPWPASRPLGPARGATGGPQGQNGWHRLVARRVPESCGNLFEVLIGPQWTPPTRQCHPVASFPPNPLGVIPHTRARASGWGPSARVTQQSFWPAKKPPPLRTPPGRPAPDRRAVCWGATGWSRWRSSGARSSQCERARRHGL